MSQPKILDGIMSLDEANDVIGAGHHKEAKNGVFKGNAPEMHFTAIRGNQTVQNTSLPINNCRLAGNAVWTPNCTLEGQAILYTGCVLDGTAYWTPQCDLAGNVVLRLCDLSGTATWIGNNAPNWVDQGYTTCVAPCSTFQVQMDTNQFSATYNNFRAGSLSEGYTYYGLTSPTPGSCNYTENWQNTGNSRCYQNAGVCTSQIEQRDVNGCSPTYNSTRWISGGSACNTAQTWTVVFGSYQCSGCNKYYVEQQTNPCASQYGQTRLGSIAESNSTYCGGCCGQSTAENWVDTGFYRCNNCVSEVEQRQTNPCATGYNTTRWIGRAGYCDTNAYWTNLNINTDWVCVGYDKYYKQIDNGSCSPTAGQTRTGALYQTNSYDCGYVPPQYTLNIYAKRSGIAGQAVYIKYNTGSGWVNVGTDVSRNTSCSFYTSVTVSAGTTVSFAAYRVSDNVFVPIEMGSSCPTSFANETCQPGIAVGSNMNIYLSVDTNNTSYGCPSV